MISSQFFCLNGFGYLEDISYSEGKCIAKIKAVNVSSQDDVYLDCEIQGALEEYLYFLSVEVKKGNTVLVSFSAIYRKFGVAFTVLESETEVTGDYILHLDCKLISVENCYINGCLVDKNYFRYKIAA